jgi:hypothetical protein
MTLRSKFLFVTIAALVAAFVFSSTSQAKQVVPKAQYTKVAKQLIKERKQYDRTIKQYKWELRQKYQPQALEAIRFGSIVTGYPYSQGVALVRCETGNTFSPYARNATAMSGSNATGLWQFLYHPAGIISSTWHRESRYAQFSPYNPYIQSVAAGEHWKKYGRSWYKGWKDICGTIADRS